MTTANGHRRRDDLAAFLRSRRERIRPEEVGLPPGTRRRTTGLRREELAQLAGVGVTWYTWLEQGRPIRASTQVLDAVARTLRLDRAERDHLYRLAGVPPAEPAADVCRVVGPEMQQILDGITTLPACLLNERFDLLGWNELYARLFPSVVRAPAERRNTLWLSFTHPACCHPYVSRAEQLGMLVAQLRSAYGRHLGEPAWTGFVAELRAASPEFGRLWDQHEVASPARYLKVFQHPAHGEMVMTTHSLAIGAAPGHRIVVYTPADAACRSALDRLIAGEGLDARFPCYGRHVARGAPSAGVLQPGRDPVHAQ